MREGELKKSEGEHFTAAILQDGIKVLLVYSITISIEILDMVYILSRYPSVS